MAVGRKRQRERKKPATLPKGSSYTNADFWISRNSAGRRMWRVRLPDFLFFKTLLLPSCMLFTRLSKLPSAFWSYWERGERSASVSTQQKILGSKSLFAFPLETAENISVSNWWASHAKHYRVLQWQGRIRSSHLFLLLPFVASVSGRRERGNCHRPLLLQAGSFNSLSVVLRTNDRLLGEGEDRSKPFPLQILTHIWNYCF